MKKDITIGQATNSAEKLKKTITKALETFYNETGIEINISAGMISENITPIGRKITYMCSIDDVNIFDGNE